MTDAQEGFILPIDMVRSTPFSLDVGFTLAKLMYRAKEDTEHNLNPNQTNGKIRLACFPLGKTLEEDLIKYLQEHCDFESFKKTDTVPVTGRLAANMEPAFNQAFEVNFQGTQAMQACADGMVHLCQSGLSPENIFMPLPADGLKAGSGQSAVYKKMAKEFPPGIGTPCCPTSHDTMLPCILAMLGSGTFFLEIHEDGSTRYSDGSFIGGRTFLGLSSLLTGEQDFSKLVEMSCRGDRHKVDMSVSDIRPPNANGNSLPLDVSIHILAKATKKPKDEINPDDVMDSLFSMWAVDIAQTSHLLALARNIPRVYFCGSFVNNEKVRRYITREFTMRNGVFSHGREDVKFEFLRNSGYIGALGAFVNKNKT